MTAGPALEMWSRQTSSVQSNNGQSYSVEVERGFTVTLDAGDSSEVAYQASGLPPLDSLYPGSDFIFVSGGRVERPSPIMALVIIKYTGEIPVSGFTGLSGSPIDMAYSINWGNTVTDELIDEDWFGKPIMNKNDEPIEGITEKVSDQVAVIERNFLAINMPAISAYLRATNSDTFLGWLPGTGRMMGYSARSNWIAGAIRYWTVSATFQFREAYRTTPAKAWFKRVRHEGFYERDVAFGEIHPAWSDTKEPVTRPVLLNNAGVRVTDPANAVWLEFQTLGSLPFNALGLT